MEGIFLPIDEVFHEPESVYGSLGKAPLVTLPHYGHGEDGLPVANGGYRYIQEPGYVAYPHWWLNALRNGHRPSASAASMASEKSSACIPAL